MKTMEQIKADYEGKSPDGRDLYRLAKFIPESELEAFGLAVKEGSVGTHSYEPFTREAVLKQLEGDVAFGFEKALDQRGISSGFMCEVVQMWNWILEEGLEGFDEYPMYGLPVFKATAVKYGFDNPIGDDTGSEHKYDG